MGFSEEFETFLARYTSVLLDLPDGFVIGTKKVDDFRKKLTLAIYEAIYA